MSGVEPNAKGTWRQVAVVVDGKNIPVPSVGLFGSGALLSVSDDGYTITVNGKVYQRGTSKADYTKIPHQSNVSVTEGPRAGESFPQIFMIEGDVLIGCNAPPGAARPTEFTSPPGSGHTLSVWLRTKETGLSWAPLTGRTWLLIGVCILLAGIVGGVSENLANTLGPWAGILGAWLAGALFFTAFLRALKWRWLAALSTGITVSIAGNTFEAVKTAVGPALSAPLATLVSGSTALVVGFLIWAVLNRLFKLQ
jgi:uncharacterized protein (TIGR03067 family)